MKSIFKDSPVASPPRKEVVGKDEVQLLLEQELEKQDSSVLSGDGAKKEHAPTEWEVSATCIIHT